MGYNSWYDLMCSPYMNETTLERTADAMVSKGLVELGYGEYYFKILRLPSMRVSLDCKLPDAEWRTRPPRSSCGWCGVV